MSDETSLQGETQVKTTEEQDRLAQQRALMEEKLKTRGAQAMSYKEYMAQKAAREKAEAKKFKAPPALKFFLITPFVLVLCFGVFFIPYMIYQIATGKSAPPKNTDTEQSSRTVKKAAETTRNR